MDKYSVFHIEGGVGKNVLATAVVSSLKKSDPERKIIITTAWPAVWFNNPNVDQVFVLGQTANFYKNFIKQYKNIAIWHTNKKNNCCNIIEKQQLKLNKNPYDFRFHRSNNSKGLYKNSVSIGSQ